MTATTSALYLGKMSHEPEFVTRAEFARRAGCTAANVSRECNHGALRDAMVGRRLDAAHPDAVAYLQSRPDPPPAEVDSAGVPWDERAHSLKKTKTGKGRWRKRTGVPRAEVDKIERELTGRGPEPEKQKGWNAYKQAKKDEALDAPDNAVIPENIRAFADMTLRDLIRRFGTDVRFSDWLKAIKQIEDIEGARIKNAREKGDLISREYVRHHVVGVIDDVLVRLLNDSPRTIAAEMYDARDAGEGVEEAEARVRSVLQGQIRNVKRRAVKGVNNA